MGPINHDTQPIWEGWQRREFRLAHCSDCGTWFHTPRRICPACWGEHIGFDEVDGSGHVVSWSLPRQPDPAAPPVVTALVAIDHAAGVNFLARLGGCDPADVRFDLPVVLHWRDDDGIVSPEFRPAGVAS
jgi:hypothetical protein